MKIVFCNKSYWQSINFIDKNDVFVGFHYDQQCCESFGYFILPQETLKIPPHTPIVDDDLIEDYVFDKDYFLEGEDFSDWNETKLAVFKLVCEGKDDLYLHLFNDHNGHYAHGFTFTDNDKLLRGGSL